MKQFVKENISIILIVLSLFAFRFVEFPAVGLILLVSAIPFAVRKFFQLDKRDKLIAEMVVLIEEKIELEEMLPLVTDKVTADKIATRLEEIEKELKVPLEGLIKIGFLKRDSE